MPDHLPPALIEACLVVGASSDNLSAVYQLATDSNGSSELPLLEPVVLHVLTPPFVSREHADGDVVGLRGHSFMKEREFPLSSALTPPNAVAYTSYEGGESEGSTVPKDIDLTALPQLCFPGGLQVTNEQKEEQFHFLVFTDVFGNQTYGVVMQCYWPILEGTPSLQNSMVSKLYSAYGFCVISKQPYYTALKDCLSCLLVQLRTCHQSDLKERLKKFAAHLSLVPIPPPGQLHVMFHLHPLNIVVPAREERDKPAVDLDLHLPLLIFRPQQLLQVLSCLLQEQRVVLFSTDWARLTLIAECFLLFLQPLSWQQPYVPVLASGMLDFLMAPTAFLMGCHISHFEEVATETDELILINIDEGIISSSCFETGFETVNLPEIPLFAADCFKQRCQSLHLHFDLHQCHRGSYCDINEQRAERRAWQQNVNREIQGITLELIVNIFSDVSCHLNYEHRVFNSVEFLNTREPSEQLFYKKVLDTHIFHSFLKDRLNSKIDTFTCMDLNTLPEIQRDKSIKERPCRHTMLSVQTRKNSVAIERRLSKGQRMPDLREDLSISYHRVVTSDSAFRTFPKPVKVLKLPDFPASLSISSVKTYYNDVILLLNETISSVPPDNSALLARHYFLRGFINSLCLRRLEALSDFQSLYKTDTDIFPTQLVTWLVGSLTEEERQQADRRSELGGLLLKTENVKTLVQPDDHVKKFRLPRTHLHQDDFVRCIQESGIVKDSATIHRLFDALTDGDHMQVDAECFRDFYSFWKKTEANTQDFSLPSEVIEHLDNSECVYKLSSCVRTSYGVGKIAMTQKRLFLLTEGRPGFQAITKFREIQEVSISSSSFLLLRSPSLRIHIASKTEVFEANLKTETDLWNLMVKEMLAGRKMADQHKDPQYVAQALTNVLLMDAVVGCLQPPSSPKAIWAASKLAYFDKVKHEELMTVSKTTAETLKHKINPSLDLAEPQPVNVLLYTPGRLSSSEVKLDRTPKLWVALGRGMVVVFDAASWSMLQSSIKVGDAQLNCMLGLNQEQVWIGSQDSVIYIIDTRSMSCNKQLTEHRDEVTGIAVDSKDLHNSLDTFSCSCDGTILLWDATGLKVKRQLHLSCDRLSSIQIHGGTLWCCCSDGIVELTKNGIPQRKMALPSDVLSMPSSFSSFLLILEQGQLWTGCADSGELCLWHIKDDCICLFKRVLLPAASGVKCIIQVKDQVWAGCRGVSADSPLRGVVLVVDPQTLAVQKKLQAHSDSVQALCSAEDRYVLSGSARHDGKVAIWRV